MSRYVTLNQLKEIPFIQLIMNHDIGEFNGEWYVELEEPFNLYLSLYL